MKSNAITLAALKWWTSKRPLAWNKEDHLKQPAVNCRGQVEHELAEAVAAALKDKENK